MINPSLFFLYNLKPNLYKHIPFHNLYYSNSHKIKTLTFYYNITNIYVEIKQPPISFDNNWNLSQISEGDKSNIMISNFMYTKLLEEILKNEINLNVIIL